MRAMQGNERAIQGNERAMQGNAHALWKGTPLNVDCNED